jgi:mannose-1-phosphate guanylyltransferase
MNHAVILAGGIGERFWPLSRVDRPKQFLPLGGDRSLLRATFERLRPLVPPDRIWVVTSASQSRLVRRELPELAPGRILREPRGRNTAPAVYWGTLAARAHDPDATVAVVPSDAWVPRAAPYRRAVARALAAAREEDRLVLIGIRPTRVETGYGYIEPGALLGRKGLREVRRFVEKPSAVRARRFVAGGTHLWNSGIFAWRAAVLEDAVRRTLPALAGAFAEMGGKRPSRSRVERAYRRAPSISVDYGILERSDNIAVVPARFPWDDLGSWRALERLGRGGGFAHGETVLVDAPGTIAWGEDGVVAVVGMEDAVVVHTRDATLVVHKDRAQDVRRVVEALARSRTGRKHLKR